MRPALLVLLHLCCSAHNVASDGEKAGGNVHALTEELHATEELIRLYERRRQLLSQLHSQGTTLDAEQPVDEVIVGTLGEVQSAHYSEERASSESAPIVHETTNNFDATFVEQQMYRWDYQSEDVLIAVLPVVWSANTTSARVLAKRNPEISLPSRLLLHIWSSGKIQAFADVDAGTDGEDVLVQLFASDGTRFEATSACQFTRESLLGQCLLATAAYMAHPEPTLLLGYQHGEVAILKVALSLDGWMLSSKSSTLQAAEGGFVLMLQAHCGENLHTVHSDLGRPAAAAVPTVAMLLAGQTGVFAVVGTAHGAVFVMDYSCTAVRAVMNSFSQETGLSRAVAALSRQAGILAVGSGDRVHFVQISKWQLEKVVCTLPLQPDDVHRAAVVSVVHDGPSSIWAATTGGDVLQFTVKHKQLSCKLAKKFPGRLFPGATPCAVWRPPVCLSNLARVVVSVHGAILAIGGGGVGLINVTSGQISSATWKQAPCVHLTPQCTGGVHLPLTFAFIADSSPDARKLQAGSRNRIWRPPAALPDQGDGVLVITRDGKTVVYNNLLAQREAAAPASGLLDTLRIPFMFAAVIVFVAIMQCQRTDTINDGAEGRPKGFLMTFLHYLGIGIGTVARGPLGHAARSYTGQNQRPHASALFGEHADSYGRRLGMSNFDQVVEQMARESRQKRDRALDRFPLSARERYQQRQKDVALREEHVNDSDEGVDGTNNSPHGRVVGDSSSGEEPNIVPRSVYDDLMSQQAPQSGAEHASLLSSPSGVQRWAETMEKLTSADDLAHASADRRRILHKARALHTSSPTSEDGGMQPDEERVPYTHASDRHVLDPDTFD